MRLIKSMLFSLLSVGLFVIAVNAQGTIIPIQCDDCPGPQPRVALPRALPIKSINIETKISGQIATTHLEQIFRNDTNATLQGTYLFPIPEQASIVEFAIWDGNNRLVGEVRSREEARRIYDEIVRRMRDPGLLEYAGKDLFQASIFPIPPHSDKKLEMTYTQVLKGEGGTVGYRYPLGTGKQIASIGKVSGAVDIESQQPIRNVYSPSHSVDVNRSSGERHVRVTFESTGGNAQDDFQLFYSLSREDFGLSLLTYREPGRDGYFMLMVSPRDEIADSELAAKDIVFVIDTSGSMAEEGKMEKARAALLFGVKSLRNEDRFNVISFAGEEHLMESGLIRADAEGRARGEKFIRSLRPTGGTNINDSLQAALKQFSSSDRPQLLVFMTDGLPTVGQTKVARIIENARETAGGRGVKLFTFGVGYDVNTELLDRLASENNGAADYVEPKEDLEVKVSSFFTKVNYPVLTNLSLDIPGVRTDLVYPRNLPDIFRGTQLTVIGRYRSESDLRAVRLLVRGRSGREAKTLTFDSLEFPLRDERNDFLPRLWANRRVGWLMEQIRNNGEQKELRDEIVDLGTRYGIVTPYTSYLAVEANQAGQRITDDQSRPITVTGGNGPMGRASNQAAPAADAVAPREAMAAKTGSLAVKASKDVRSRQESTIVDKEVSEKVIKNVGSKTFYQSSGAWTDAEVKSDSTAQVVTVKFASDAYYDLLKKEPGLAQYFALGQEVTVLYKGRVYKVSA